MDVQARFARAERLFLLRVWSKTPPAEAWRTVNPMSNASDMGAAERTRREIRWYSEERDRRSVQPRKDSPFDPRALLSRAIATEDETTLTNSCVGVGDRQCGEQIPARYKRCQDCGAENERLLKQAANSRYFQRHREALNEKRRNRRRKQRKLATNSAEVRAAKRNSGRGKSGGQADCRPAAVGFRRERKTPILVQPSDRRAQEIDGSIIL